MFVHACMCAQTTMEKALTWTMAPELSKMRWEEREVRCRMASRERTSWVEETTGAKASTVASSFEGESCLSMDHRSPTARGPKIWAQTQSLGVGGSFLWTVSVREPSQQPGGEQSAGWSAFL